MTSEDDVRLISAFEARHPELTVTLLETDSPSGGVVVRMFDKDRPSTPKWEGQGQTVRQALEDAELQMNPARQDQQIQEEKEFLEDVYREVHEEA
jgi:hypothetical protein